MSMTASVIDTHDGLDGLEDRWERLRKECGAGIYSSYFLTRSWLENYRAVSSPRIVLVEEHGELVGLAPLAVHTHRSGRLSVNVLALAGRVAGRLFISPSTILLRPGRDDALEPMLKAMRGMDWSFLSAIYMEDIHPASRFIEVAGRTWRPEPHPENSLVILSLPEGDISAMYEAGARRSFEKRSRALERGGHKVSLRKVASEDLDRAVETYARQHIERWENKGGSYFRNPENVLFLRSALKEAALRNKSFAHEILIDGEVAAQNFGFVEGDRAYSYRLGMNDAFARYSPGWMVKHFGMTDLRDNGVIKCDFGVGEEKFKTMMGGTTIPLIVFRASRGLMSLLSRAQSIKERFERREHSSSRADVGPNA